MAVELAAVVVEEPLLVELDSVVVAGEGMVIVVRVPDVSEDNDEEEVVLLDVVVSGPSVVGVSKELGFWVSATLTLTSAMADGAPSAVARTVAARALAVPHPNCEKPPS